jgi:predicted DNA-binding transcriptional regulator YafY
MDALSAAGVPVVAERGQGGGWSLLDGYQTKLTGLNAAEIQAVVLNNPADLLNDLGLQSAAQAAWLKLLASLPEIKRDAAAVFRERIYIDNGRWHKSTEETPCLSALQDALWQECRVKLVYERGDGEMVERLVDPLGLVAKRSVWYLVAAVEGEMRTYRVSRVKNLEFTDEPAQRPPDFDLATYWHDSTEEFRANLPKYPALLKVRDESRHLLTFWRWAQVEQIEPADTDGWCLAHVMFEVIEEAAGAVLGAGTQIYVIEPDELRQRVIDMAREVAAFYANQSSG